MDLKSNLCKLAEPAAEGPGRLPSSSGGMAVSSSERPVPGWLPAPVLLYLSHTEQGISLRALARQAGVNASTVLRQVRRYESRRDDPLMDAALDALRPGAAACPASQKERLPMTVPQPDLYGRPVRSPQPRQVIAGQAEGGAAMPDEAELEREARRVLRRMAEPGAVLAFAPGMERAVVMREHADGRSTRSAILDRRVAQAFILKDWIGCIRTGRVSTYEIAPAGRAILRRLLALDGTGRAEQGQGLASGLAEAAGTFQGFGGDGAPRRGRITLAESPVVVLARRPDRDGQPFLGPELVQAAERLREDFEAAQLTQRHVQNWERHCPEPKALPDGAGTGMERAQRRVATALADLGPGLADVALRVCCLLEGVESAERRMGWAARSGKIVLRIALQRLRRHYDRHYGRSGPLIG